MAFDQPASSFSAHFVVCRAFSLFVVLPCWVSGFYRVIRKKRADCFHPVKLRKINESSRAQWSGGGNSFISFPFFFGKNENFDEISKVKSLFYSGNGRTKPNIGICGFQTSQSRFHYLRGALLTIPIQSFAVLQKSQAELMMVSFILFYLKWATSYFLLALLRPPQERLVKIIMNYLR